MGLQADNDTKKIMHDMHKQELVFQQEQLMKKAMKIDDQLHTLEEQGTLGTEVSKVFLEPVTPTYPFGMQEDPYNKYDAGGYRKKPTLLNYKLLRSLAKRVEPIAAIIRLRCNQAASFSQPQYDKDVPGFRIALKDPKAVPTSADRAEMKKIEEFFVRTGFTENPKRKDNFEQFQKKIIRDRLTLDAIATQLVANKKGQITEFWAMDAGTIHFAQDDYEPRRGETYYPIEFVQELDGRIIGEFTGLEMAYGVAFPSTALNTYGYGESELELLVEIITSYLFSREYNKTFFTKNSVPPGIISLIGEYKEEEVQMFRRQWAAQLHGVANAFRVPVVVSKEGKGADFKSLKTTQRDAEFMKWIDFLIRITAAVYQTSPEEINFSMGASGSESPLVAREGGQQILNSKDKGLVPLLRFLQGYYNTHFISKFNDKYRFEFTGIELKDKDRDLERKKKKSFFMSINELRKEDDLDPLDFNKIDNLFDLPDNPNIQQAWINKQEQERMAEMENNQEQPEAQDMIPLDEFPSELDSQMKENEKNEEQAMFPPELDANLHKELKEKQKIQEEREQKVQEQFETKQQQTDKKDNMNDKA